MKIIKYHESLDVENISFISIGNTLKIIIVK